jgi:hypothetical protein
VRRATQMTVSNLDILETSMSKKREGRDGRKGSPTLSAHLAPAACLRTLDTSSPSAGIQLGCGVVQRD